MTKNIQNHDTCINKHFIKLPILITIISVQFLDFYFLSISKVLDHIFDIAFSHVQCTQCNFLVLGLLLVSRRKGTGTGNEMFTRSKRASFREKNGRRKRLGGKLAFYIYTQKRCLQHIIFIFLCINIMFHAIQSSGYYIFLSLHR